jgi:hypothetical protein
MPPHDMKFWSLFVAIWVGSCFAVANIVAKIEFFSKLSAMSD